jgi:hypothetical protein
MAIPTGSIVVPAVSFPGLWAKNITINSTVNGDGTASCLLIPYAVDSSGNVTQGDAVKAQINNLVSRAAAQSGGSATDPLLAAAMELVFLVIGREFLSQSLIPAPAKNPATDAGVLAACNSLLGAIAAAS